MACQHLRVKADRNLVITCKDCNEVITFFPQVVLDHLKQNQDKNDQESYNRSMKGIK